MICGIPSVLGIGIGQQVFCKRFFLFSFSSPLVGVFVDQALLSFLFFSFLFPPFPFWIISEKLSEIEFHTVMSEIVWLIAVSSNILPYLWSACAVLEVFCFTWRHKKTGEVFFKSTYSCSSGIWYGRVSRLVTVVGFYSCSRSYS